MDCFMNRRIVVSVLVAVFVMVGLASPAIAQASTDAVLVLQFDEGSGTIAKDESGYGNDRTIHGAKWVDGKYGKALSFDGVADYVVIPDSASLDITNDITIEMWIKHNDLALATFWSRTSSGEYTSQLNVNTGPGSNKIEFRLWDNTPTQHSIYSRSSTTPGVWYHIVTTRDSSGQKIYINGLLNNRNSDSFAIRPLTNQMAIGTWMGVSNNSLQQFNGIIDEVRIYNRALTTDEIKTHYEGKQTELTLTTSASPSTIQEGETTTISIRVENTGTVDAKSVELTDTIPTGFKIISGSKSASFDEIKPGDYRTFEYTLKATGIGKFTCDPATATYKDDDGNSHSATSNSVSIQVGGEVPVGADSDGDGWSDDKEREMGTNPYSVDSDGDGLKDPEDPNPTVPEEKKTPGFEVISAIAGLLAIAYLLRRRG